LLVAVAAIYVLYKLMQSAGNALGGGSSSIPDPAMPDSSQSFPGVDPSKVYQFAYAIAVAEGFYASGSIPQRANNPGDLEEGNIGYGTLGQGITIFPDPSSGWEALYAQAWEMLSGNSSHYRTSETIAQAGLTYSGGDPNWSGNVAATLGTSPLVTLEGWLAS